MPSIKDSFLNDGAVSPRTRGEVVQNDSGGTLSPGDLVYFSGWAEGATVRDRSVRKVKKADANLTDAPAQAVVRTTILSGSQARVFKTYRLTDQATNAGSVGDPVYLSMTAAGWTLTAPTSPDARVQTVGRIAVSHATTGAIEFNLDEAQPSGRLPAASLTDLPVRNESGGTLAVGDLVYVSGWSETHIRHLVTKADSDATTPAKRATYIVTASISNNANGTVSKSSRLTGLNTNAGNVSDPVYLSATAGGWTLTPPTAAVNRVQIVGRIAVKSATVGEIEFNLTANDAFSQLGNGDLLAGTLSADAAGRALMADGIFNAATVEAKFAAASFAASATARALIATGFFDAATLLDKVAALAIVDSLVAAQQFYARVIANSSQIAAGAMAAADIAIPVVFQLVVPDGASGNVDFTSLPYKIRILRVDYQKAGGAGNAGNSMTLNNGATANVIAGPLNSATDNLGDSTASSPSAVLDDAFTTVAAAATLRVVTVRAGGNNAAVLTVTAMRIA